jgi:transcriptional regulator with XRE-family HTH domain
MGRPKRKELTEKQKLFADYYIGDVEGELTQKQFAEKIGVSEKTLSLWKREPLFRDYVNDLAYTRLLKDYPEIVRNLANRAKRDNQAARIYLDHKDKIDGRLEGLGDGHVIIVMPNRNGKGKD